jgi:putative ABC transport system permease protein
MKNTPPKIPLRFFRWYCHPKIQNYIEGDLMEVYERRVKKSGKRMANFLFVRDVLFLLRPGIIKPAYRTGRPAEGYQRINQNGMFKNYFKVGIRNILKYKVFSFINVFGLAVAMSVCMLIILMLADQKRYDDFHDKKDRIYRVLTKIPTSFKPNASSPFPLAAAMKAEYPIVEEATHLVPGVGGDVVFGKNSIELRGFFADAAFFKVFSFELAQGDRNTALSTPRSMIITSEKAYALFGTENPIGKTVDFKNRGLNHLMGDGENASSDWGSYTITGIYDKESHKSHIKFDVLLSASSMESLYAEDKFQNSTDNWKWYSSCYTYLLLSPQHNAHVLTVALNDLTSRKYVSFEDLKGLELIGQPLTEITPGIFLGNPISFSLPIEVYYFLALLAFAIIISAGVNYTNLSTARVLTRVKEIGIRKVTGARRKDLIFQFLSESVIIAFLSLALAIVLLLFMKPAFKGLWVNQYLNFELQDSIGVYAAFFVFALVVGLLAGAYPALLLSKYQPIQAIKKEGGGFRKMNVQKFLSVSQFVSSLFFITTSILLYNQFKHHLSVEYGFNPKQVANVRLQGNEYTKVYTELSKVPGVVSISATDYMPATGTQNGISLKISGSEKDHIGLTVLLADEHFAKNLELRIIAGKDLPPTGSSGDHFILVNESAVKKWGYKHPAEIVGQHVERYGSNELFEVVGVIEDFRFRMPSEQEEIAPLIIRNQPSGFRYANVRIASAGGATTLQRLEEAWKRIDPVHPISYQFYDEQLTETNLGFIDIVSIIGFIAFLAVTISCLGLLGMATYTVERRTKEVGVRKVLGAGDMSIAFLLSKSFLRMLGISICIGAPLSYGINALWLQYVPNRVGFGFGTILLSVFTLTAMGVITIGSQTLRASKSNPVDSLKIE